MKLSTANLAHRVALVERQRYIMANDIDTHAHGDIGGSRVRTLRDTLHNVAMGRCVACKQVTSLTVPAWAVDASTIGLLIPSAMFGPSGTRAGYTAGNVANFCRACVNLSNLASEDGSVWVWVPAVIDAWLVPMTWPSLPKTTGPRITTESTADVARWIAKCRAVLTLRGCVLPA